VIFLSQTERTPKHFFLEKKHCKQQYSNDIFTQEESFKKHLFHKDKPQVLIFI
jgi:hypothetical protein